MTRVDYDDAVRAYETRLDTKLRGFAEDELFARWVPDPDPMRGVLSLLEAAAEAGVDTLEVVLSDETLGKLDVTALGEAAPGEIVLEGTVLRATLKEGTREGAVRRPGPRPARPAEPNRVLAADAPLHASYRERAAQRKITRAEPAPEDSRRVSVEGATVWIVGDDVVRRAGHEGAGGELAAVLDVWCEIVEGMPRTEATEHGVHRVMDRLRDPAAPPPVPGVVTPRNASPLFRALLEAAWQLGEGVEPDSRWSPEPSEPWLARSDEERLSEVRRVLAEACEAIGLDPAHVRAETLRGHIKIRLEYADEVPIADRRRAPLALERILQDRLEPTLVIERQPRRDLNVLRRL